jgi:hypothetical protein
MKPKRYLPYEEVISFVDKTEDNNKISENHVVFASTVCFSNDVFLHPLPNKAFEVAERYIGEILEHEQLHLAMYRFGLVHESKSFDNLFPEIGDFQNDS